MKTFSIRNSGSATAVMVQAFDFLAVCVGGWLSYQLRFSDSLSPVEMHSGDQMVVLGMAFFSVLFFGKIYRLWPGGSLGAMLGLPPTVEPGEPRLLVVGDDVRRCAFHVYRPALQEADSGGVGAPPATLSAALESHVRGILRLGDRPWSWLDADRLLTSLERRLA